MGTPISGQYGQVDFGSSVIADANHWTMEDTVDASQFGTFGGGGFKDSNVGQKSATGTIEGVYDRTNPIEQEAVVGASVDLSLYFSTVAGGGVRKRVVPAHITGISYDVDGDTGEKNTYSINWQSDGAWTEVPAA